jgi:hypothetical protein
MGQAMRPALLTPAHEAEIRQLVTEMEDRLPEPEG